MLVFPLDPPHPLFTAWLYGSPLPPPSLNVIQTGRQRVSDSHRELKAGSETDLVSVVEGVVGGVGGVGVGEPGQVTGQVEIIVELASSSSSSSSS